MPQERLQKIIAHAGLASRRKAEQWIVEGHVSVNGKVVRELGTRADPAIARIRVDGKSIRFPHRLVYVALYKPRKCVTTRSDPQGRRTVMDFLKQVPERVYPVGRLDYHSEGLLLLTNDGDFANHIISASSRVPKTYWVKVTGQVPEEALDKLRQGIPMGRRRTLPARIRMLGQINRRRNTTRDARENPWYEVVLHEGRRNQIRRMFALVGHPVRKLRRVRIGKLALGTLLAGKCRYLTPAEVKSLYPGRANE